MANRDHFNEYSSALDHNVVMAQATLTSIFNSFTSDMSVRDIKKNLRELYPALVREYGDRAAQMALEYYESERTAYLEETNQDDDLYNPGIPNGVPLQYLHKDVDDTCARYHVKNQPESVYTALSGAASNRIMKMSDSTLAHAMKGDRLRPKWALVSRLLSCSWCSMISSFGFHYNSAYNVEKARHKPNPTACRCSVCVDFNHDDPRLKGYDPDKMYYKFSAIADKLGIDFTRDNQANTLARKRILAAYEKSQRKSRAVNARITKVADSLGIKVVDGKATNAADKKILFSELKLRDRQWLLTGKPPEVDNNLFDTTKMNKQQLHDYRKDKRTADVLCQHGLQVIMTDNPLVKSSRSQVRFDFEIGGKKVESKSPEGSGYLAVAGNIDKADEKFRKIGTKSQIVISNLDSSMDDQTFLDYYQQAKVDSRSEWGNIHDIILVLKDNTIRRIYI